MQGQQALFSALRIQTCSICLTGNLRLRNKVPVQGAHDKLLMRLAYFSWPVKLKSSANAA